MGNLEERWKRGLGGKERKYEGSCKGIAEGTMLIHTLNQKPTHPSPVMGWGNANSEINVR